MSGYEVLQRRNPPLSVELVGEAPGRLGGIPRPNPGDEMGDAVPRRGLAYSEAMGTGLVRPGIEVGEERDEPPAANRSAAFADLAVGTTLAWLVAPPVPRPDASSVWPSR